MKRQQLKIKVSLWTNCNVERVTLFPSNVFSYQIYGPRLTIDAFFKAYPKGIKHPLPPLNWEPLTQFTRRVLEALKTIPFGQSRTYGEMAAQIGCPGGAQAVGRALGRNPFPLLLPCHRVLAKRGIGGFSAGLDLKYLLLEHESLYACC